MAQELLNKQLLWYKKKLQAFPGRMVITEERFTYARAPKWAAAFGLIGALIASGSKGSVMIDDEIKNLKFAKGRSMGKKAYMLNVTTPDGNSYDFLFDDSLLAKVDSVINLEELVDA